MRYYDIRKQEGSGRREKRDWTLIKSILFAYLLISKMWYWMEIIAHVDGFTGVGSAVLERLVNRDIVIILLLVCIYSFEHLIILKQKKWNSFLSQVVVVLFGFVMYIGIFSTYSVILSFISIGEINVGNIIANLLPMSFIYIIFATIIFMKVYFKKKEAYDYAVDIQTADIKLEVLNSLLEDGVLTQEEFDNQKAKLLEV